MAKRIRPWVNQGVEISSYIKHEDHLDAHRLVFKFAEEI